MRIYLKIGFWASKESKTFFGVSVSKICGNISASSSNSIGLIRKNHDQEFESSN